MQLHTYPRVATENLIATPGTKCLLIFLSKVQIRLSVLTYQILISTDPRLPGHPQCCL